MISSVKIGPIVYQVKEKDDLHRLDGDGRKQWLHGHVLYADAEIRVANDQDDQVKLTAVWHEALHAILYAAGVDDSNLEPVIRALGYALVQFVRDNPDLIQLTVQREPNEQP